MTKLIGQFKRYEGTNGEVEWAAGATVTIALVDGQKVSEGGLAVEVPATTFVCDEQGRVPEGTEIIGNDKLWPEGTCYKISVADECADSLANLYGYRAITGSDVDLSALELNPFHTGAWAPPEPAPIPFPVPIPTRRQTPCSPKKAGVNYQGFHAIVITPPPQMEAVCAIPQLSAENTPFGRVPGSFCVSAFMLPFAAVVNWVSIKVDTPKAGSSALGLYDWTGKQVCSARIDTSRPDEAEGDLGREIPLEPGEYFLAWSGVRGVKLYSVGQNHGQFRVGSIDVPDGTKVLPTTIELTRIKPCHSLVPPAVYFKA